MSTALESLRHYLHDANDELDNLVGIIEKDHDEKDRRIQYLEQRVESLEAQKETNDVVLAALPRKDWADLRTVCSDMYRVLYGHSPHMEGVLSEYKGTARVERGQRVSDLGRRIDVLLKGRTSA